MDGLCSCFEYAPRGTGLDEVEDVVVVDEVEFGGRDGGAELAARFGVGMIEDDLGLEVVAFVSRNSGGGIWQSG